MKVSAVEVIQALDALTISYQLKHDDLRSMSNGVIRMHDEFPLLVHIPQLLLLTPLPMHAFAANSNCQ